MDPTNKHEEQEETEGKGELTSIQERQIIDFVKAAPNLDDAVFHAFCESLGVDPHEAEEVVYRHAQEKKAKIGEKPEPDEIKIPRKILGTVARKLRDKKEADKLVTEALKPEEKQGEIKGKDLSPKAPVKGVDIRGFLNSGASKNKGYVSPDQMRKGMKVEEEHVKGTAIPKPMQKILQRKIVKDHVAGENMPNYYDHLGPMEEKAKKEAQEQDPNKKRKIQRKPQSSWLPSLAMGAAGAGAAGLLGYGLYRSQDAARKALTDKKVLDRFTQIWDASIDKSKAVWDNPMYNLPWMARATGWAGTQAGKIPGLTRITPYAAKLKTFAVQPAAPASFLSGKVSLTRAGSILPALAYNAWMGEGGAIDQLRGKGSLNYLEGGGEAAIANAALFGIPEWLGRRTSNWHPVRRMGGWYTGAKDWFKGGSDMTSYEQGFIAACKKAGFTEEQTIKMAQAYRGYKTIGINTNMPISKYRDLTPREEQAVDEGKSQWIPKIFTSKGTPIPELMSSPTVQGGATGLLGGMAGAGVGGLAGLAAGHPYLGAGAGSGVGAILGFLLGKYSREAKNQSLEDYMHRLPRTNDVPRIRDMESDPIYQKERNRQLKRELSRRGNPDQEEIPELSYLY